MLCNKQKPPCFGVHGSLAYFYRPMSDAAIKIKELLAALPAATRRKAEKLPVREAEEADKGEWVAFVDDGANSYDVQLSISRGNLLRHTCDCGKLDADGFCLHQMALLLHISTISTSVPTAPKTKRNKKEDPIDTLLAQVEYDELRAWVKELLQQKKDVMVAFTTRFSAKPTDYTLAEIMQMTDAAVKSIVKNKKRIDQSELKQILALWQKVHAPVIACYLNNITSTEKIYLLAGILLAVYKWQFELQINTTRFSSYMVDVLAHTIAPLHDIAVESAWQKVLAAYMAELAKVANPLAQQWAIFLAKLAKATPQRARTDFVLQKLETIYKKACSSKGEVVIEWFTRLLFELYESLDRLPECIDWIQPIIYQNEYNLKLIGLLTEAGNYQRAEALCLRIIKANYQEEYNLPYLICLKKIYAMQPDKRSKLHEIILKIFPLHCTLADYKMIVVKCIGKYVCKMVSLPLCLIIWKEVPLAIYCRHTLMYCTNTIK
ncbi:MAG: hypothetical protein MUF24_04365 [Chitinophagaceae bacterium]|nr:hypothetical protein [Chitinophagaceae bacterium]